MRTFEISKADVERMKEEKDIEGLIKALKYKKNWEVRTAAAWVLGKIGDETTAEPLIQALKDEDVSV